jgi:hypothetical protein
VVWHQIVDMDKLKIRKKLAESIPDFIVLFELAAERVAIVEMKGGLIDASEVHDQISSGARMAQEWVQGNVVAAFYPIVLSGRGIKPVEYRILMGKKYLVEFGGKKYRIIPSAAASHWMTFCENGDEQWTANPDRTSRLSASPNGKPRVARRDVARRPPSRRPVGPTSA